GRLYFRPDHFDQRRDDLKSGWELVLGLHPGARSPQNPCDGETSAEIALSLDQRAVRKYRAADAVPFRKGADPEIRESLADRREEVHSAVAAARVESGPVRRGENRIDCVEILVVAPVRVDEAALQAEIPPGVSQGVLEIQADVRLKNPAGLPDVGEIGGEDSAQRKPCFQPLHSVPGSVEGDVER